MTLSVGDHGLTCLDGNDYGAISLWLQKTAQTVDSELTGISSGLSTYLNRPYFKATSTVAVTFTSNTAGSGFVLPDGKIGELFYNTAQSTYINNGGLLTGRANGGNIFNPYRIPPGIYLVGSTVNYTVATPTNNSQRTLMIWGETLVSGSAVNVNVYSRKVLEAGGAGNNGAITVMGLLDARLGNIAGIQAGMWHENAASAITITAGGWSLWMMRIGSGLVV